MFDKGIVNQDDNEKRTGSIILLDSDEVTDFF